MNPIEGAKNGGLDGFLQGSFNGITGLVVKPLTGSKIYYIYIIQEYSTGTLKLLKVLRTKCL